MHQLAQTLGLDIDYSLKLPGEAWPFIVLLKYEEMVQRLERRADESTNEGNQASIVQNEGPLAKLHTQKGDEQVLDELSSWIEDSHQKFDP